MEQKREEVSKKRHYTPFGKTQFERTLSFFRLLLKDEKKKKRDRDRDRDRDTTGGEREEESIARGFWCCCCCCCCDDEGRERVDQKEGLLLLLY